MYYICYQKPKYYYPMTKQKKNLSLTLSEGLVKRIDSLRGLIPRSTYIEDILSKAEEVKKDD